MKYKLSKYWGRKPIETMGAGKPIESRREKWRPIPQPLRGLSVRETPDL